MSNCGVRRHDAALHFALQAQDQKINGSIAAIDKAASCRRTPKREVFMSATLTIRIDDVLERELKRVAVATHRSKSYIVREALRRQLALARFRAVREEVMPLAEKNSLLTDEDVFKKVS